MPINYSDPNMRNNIAAALMNQQSQQQMMGSQPQAAQGLPLPYTDYMGLKAGSPEWRKSVAAAGGLDWSSQPSEEQQPFMTRRGWSDQVGTGAVPTGTGAIPTGTGAVPTNIGVDPINAEIDPTKIPY